MKGIFNLEPDEETAENNEIAVSSEINDDGSFLVRFKDKIFCCISIIGQIEGHHILSADIKTTKYEHIIPKIISVGCDESISGLLLILNTVGGDIEAGMAIAELVAGLKKPVVSIVLGGGHSIGIPLAVCADKAFISETATMTVHPVRTNGMIIGVPQQLAYFQNMQDRIVSFVCKHSGISVERMNSLMMSSGTLVGDFGTVLDGSSAVNEGIIDSVGTIHEALEELVNLSSSQY
ncbi:MAG: ATP-dependent Clp protease proteolytic subunit [Clostridia bacterium]|nr:ATP-dependent Clp protease proteolytic subunit [Clostridia bacterium]